MPHSSEVTNVHDPTGKSVRSSRSGFARLVQPTNEKYSSFVFSEIMLALDGPGPKEGAYRERHIRWAGDAVDADAPLDERRGCGRQSRVVPARNAGAKLSQGSKGRATTTVANKRVHRGEHEISR